MPPLEDNREDREVTLNKTLSWCAAGLGAGLIVAGALTAGLANATNVHAIAGGYTMLGCGWTLLSIGVVAARNHAIIMQRQQRHFEHLAALHAETVARLDDTRQSIGLAVTDEVAQHRNGT